MTILVRAACLALCLFSAAQAQTGLETPWDARKIIENVLHVDQQLKPVLGSIDPKDWYENKGAASSYVIQWQTAQRQLNDVEIVAKEVLQKTDNLPKALDLYFRLEALELTARAVDEGAKKYAERAVSDHLAALIASNFDSRQRLREYLSDLASDLEQNYKIADGEAQRCRGMISKEPLPLDRKAKKN